MTWTYSQSSGELSQDGVFAGTGYSGAGIGRNNPAAQATPNTGPVPQGKYTIGAPYTSPQTGPITMMLTPEPETNVFGRFAFRIHGDNASHTASHGCIILGPAIRKEIAASGDTQLEVLP